MRSGPLEPIALFTSHLSGDLALQLFTSHFELSAFLLLIVEVVLFNFIHLESARSLACSYSLYLLLLLDDVVLLLH